MKQAVTSYKTRKNQGTVKPIFLYEIQYDKTGNQWLRYANWPANVTFDGFVYTHYAIEHDSFQEGLDGRGQRVTLTIANVDRSIQYYLEQYAGLRDAQVNILQVFQEELANPLAVDRISLYVSDVSISSSEASLVLANKFDVFDVSLPRRKYYRSYCSHLFKDEGCAYSGAEISCDKTFQRCIALGNPHRFGGYPAIPQKNIINV